MRRIAGKCSQTVVVGQFDFKVVADFYAGFVEHTFRIVNDVTGSGNR